MKSRAAEHFRKYKILFFNSIPEENTFCWPLSARIDAGQVVFKEGDRAECFYIIAHGEIKVTVRGKTNSAAAGALARKETSVWLVAAQPGTASSTRICFFP